MKPQYAEHVISCFVLLSTLTDCEDSSYWHCPLGAYTTNTSPLLFFRSGHSSGLHCCLRPGCDDPSPLPAATSPAEQQHQGGAQTHHVHRLQDRDTPPQLSQGQHEGILHLITSELNGPQSHKLTSISLSYKKDYNRWTCCCSVPYNKHVSCPGKMYPGTLQKPVAGSPLS